MTMEKFAAQAKKENPEDAERLIAGKKQEIERDLERLDWKHWLGVAPQREYWPGLYHSFQWRGWWDFGSGALGDMACHQVTVPFASCGLRDPVSVVAKTTGHDYDSFPASSIIEFQFPETSERPAIPFWWYDRKGNKPPQEVFSKWGINSVSDSGVLDRRREGCLLQQRRLLRPIRAQGRRARSTVDFEKAENKGNNDVNNMYELFRALAEGRSEDLPVELHRSSRSAHRNDPAGQPGRLGRRQGWRRTVPWATGARRSSGMPRT